jgi:hypothetical protein
LQTFSDVLRHSFTPFPLVPAILGRVACYVDILFLTKRLLRASDGVVVAKGIWPATWISSGLYMMMTIFEYLFGVEDRDGNHTNVFFLVGTSGISCMTYCT